jgi:hypothetical protein
VPDIAGEAGGGVCVDYVEARDEVFEVLDCGHTVGCRRSYLSIVSASVPELTPAYQS